MSYKTILVNCDASKKLPHSLAVATELSMRFGSHLVGLHARPPFQAPAFFEGGIAMNSVYEAYEASAKADLAMALEAYESAIKGRALSTEWRVANGFIDGELAVHARYADLLVLGQTDPAATIPTPDDLPEAAAMATGRPTLVVPHIGAAKPVGKNILLCWNASRESARAATDALPFLTKAGKVTVLVVNPKSSANGHGQEPGADVATWLVRHGVKVTVQRDVATDENVGDVILSRAADHDSDLIVMGVYGHSRLREFVLGGASRTVLSSMTVPVLMAH